MLLLAGDHSKANTKRLKQAVSIWILKDLLIGLRLTPARPVIFHPGRLGGLASLPKN